MMSNFNDWNENDHVIVESCGMFSSGDNRKEGSPKEMAIAFNNWVEQYGSFKDGNPYRGMVFQLTADRTGKDGCSVEVTAWQPNTCQGRCFDRCFMRYVPESLLSQNSDDKAMDDAKKETLQEQDDKSQENDDEANDHNIKEEETYASSEETSEAEVEPTSPHGPNDEVEAIRKGFDCLFYIVASSGIPNLQVMELGQEVAYDSLVSALKQNDQITNLEFRNCLQPWQTQLTIDLCCGLLQTLPRLKVLYFPHIHVFDQEQLNQVFYSVGRSNLEAFDVRNDRRVHTWSKDIKTTNEGAKERCIMALLKGLANGFAPKTLDLSGNKVSTESIIALAKLLPQLSSLETLLLRDTDLDTSALVAIVSMLGHKDNNLKKLDLSHSTITDAGIMNRLCQSLRQNKILTSLLLDHCSIPVGCIEILAKELPNIKGLRHLSLESNDFLWSPRQVVVNDHDEFVGMSPVGVVLLVNALEHCHCLLTLWVGVDWAPNTAIGRSCCTPPTYFHWMDPQSDAKLSRFLKRNNDKYQREKKTKMQEAVVRLAGLLLEKM